ncbi:hypothetical protein ACP70R_018650 [Stipagrostis hirtigluma subsp. patula]
MWEVLSVTIHLESFQLLGFWFTCFGVSRSPHFLDCKNKWHPSLLTEREHMQNSLLPHRYLVWDIDKPRSIIVRVEVKFPANFHGDEQHFIIMDIMGSKIEAIVLDTSVPRLNMLLSEGRSYVLHQVKFHPNCEDLLFRNIAHPYECIFNSHTTVEPYTEALQFPLHPRHLMPLDQVRGRPNKTFMDIAGIIVHWGQLEHLGHYPQRKAYREITLMDTSFNLIIVGIHSEYLTRHAISLPSAATNKQIVLGTMLKKNKRHACLETSRHTTLAFNPVHPATHGLQMDPSILNEWRYRPEVC